MRFPAPSYCVRMVATSIISMSLVLTQNASARKKVEAPTTYGQTGFFKPSDGYIDAVPQRYPFCPAALKPDSYELPSKQIIEGDTGWFFIQDDINWSADFSPAFYQDLKRITAALKKQGTQLVIVVPPPRALTGYDHLPQWALANGVGRSVQAEAYRGLLDRIRAVGALIPDVLGEAKRQNVPFDHLTSPSDIHWTTTGSWITALAVARQIAPQRLAQGAPPLLGTPSAKMEDSYTKILNKICGTTAVGQYVRSFKLAEEPQASADSLLGDTAAPEVVILGTSFTALTDRYSFSPFVEKLSGKPVVNLAVTGGGPLTAIQQYTTSEDFRTSKPKYIVWEFLLSNKPDGSSTSERGGLLRPACGGAYPIVKHKLAPMLTPLLSATDIARGTTPGQSAQLALRSDNPAFKSFSLLLNYVDGRQRNIAVDTRRATQMDTSYTVGLPDDYALISDIAVETEDSLNGTVSAQLCPASGELADAGSSFQPSWFSRLAAWFKSFWG
ncbi:hypothetical protein C1T17_05555 [Sphingobium sp. SCG-1]|nr:hypothetical protein C1T17_05555 [Sphingobium sp. SCG-1]